MNLTVTKVNPLRGGKVEVFFKGSKKSRIVGGAPARQMRPGVEVSINKNKMTILG